MNGLRAGLSGLLFGLGLLLGGMVQPLKVKGFLDLAGPWDPSLALVMAGAVAVGIGAFALARRQRRAWNGEAIDLPGGRRIDARLVLGGVLFGIGWGVAGYCPGPALVALGAGQADAALFFVAMLGGMALHDRFLGEAPG